MGGKMSGAERDVRRILAESGVQALMDANVRIRELEAQLAALTAENERLRELLHEFEDSPDGMRSLAWASHAEVEKRIREIKEAMAAVIYLAVKISTPEKWSPIWIAEALEMGKEAIRRMEDAASESVLAAVMGEKT